MLNTLRGTEECFLLWVGKLPSVDDIDVFEGFPVEFGPTGLSGSWTSALVRGLHGRVCARSVKWANLVVSERIIFVPIISDGGRVERVEENLSVFLQSFDR
jgi:hypothetical protein